MKRNDKALTGKNNSRLYKHKPLNNAVNAAWNDVQSLKNETNASVPTMEGVKDAKDFVDEHEM